MARAASKSPPLMSWANLGEPATLVRSPMLMKLTETVCPAAPSGSVSRAWREIFGARALSPVPEPRARGEGDAPALSEFSRNAPLFRFPRLVRASRPLRRRDGWTFGGTRGGRPLTAWG